MGRVYVGTSLLNAVRAQQIIARFREAGVAVTYDWTTHNQVYDDSDLVIVGQLEEEGVRTCDLFFMIQPARNGTHCEFGMARAWGKPVVILEEVIVEKKTFYYRPGVYRFKTEDEAVTFALKLLHEDQQ
jgi:nucleoside 2-deoxyribosyltransferase